MALSLKSCRPLLLNCHPNGNCAFWKLGQAQAARRRRCCLSCLPTKPDYHFTDLSDLFLSRAEERFAAYPFVSYGIMDIEKPLAEQGQQPHSFDVIVAANVLHATRNLDETLAHVQELLAPGGLLILFETTAHLTWFDITTSLIEGWGLYEDGWRHDNPLLPPKQWQAALQSNWLYPGDSVPGS